MTDNLRVAEATAILKAARAGGDKPTDFPPSCRPRDAADAYAIQAAMAPSLGPIAAWKVGTHAPGATPMCSPIPAASLLTSPAVMPGPSRYRGLEAEMVFRLNRDLAPGGVSRAEMEAAIASCHLAIEVIECRFAQMDGADPLSVLADLQNHEALVVGEGRADWRAVDFAALPLTLQIDDQQAAKADGRADDLIDLLLWLANTGSAWAGGLKAGQSITTGSWFAKVPAPPEASARISAPGFADVAVRFAT